MSLPPSQLVSRELSSRCVLSTSVVRHREQPPSTTLLYFSPWVTRPEAKGAIIAEAEAEVAEIESQYASGLVTQGEKYNKVVDIWSRANDLVARSMIWRILR